MGCSKKNWAYTFVALGITFLVLGIVCGFVIPKIVIGIVEDKACIDSNTDSDYEDWVKEKPDSTVTKLYYWEITNKDGFLYDGELPQLKERGPYVYKQTTQKIDVTFKENKRSSKTWNKNATFSAEESCEWCKEDDQITILNAGYVGLMEKFGGDSEFAIFMLPKTISSLLKQFNYSYEQLGNSKETVWNDTLKSGWTRPGFGAWIQTVPHYANKTNYTEVQMKGLYNVLSSQAILFGETSNATVKKECLKNPSPKKCGFVLQLKRWLSAPSRPLYASITNTLCPNASVQCFAIPDTINMIYLYIQHINRYTVWLLIGEQNELVATISQKNVAMGYKMPVIKAPVPGILKVYSKEDEAKKNAIASTFYTCEADNDKKHQYAAYGGKTSISVIPNITAEDSIVRGYHLYVPRSKTADKPCTFSHELAYKHLELFVSNLGMRVTVRYKGETSLHGLELKRFTPNEDNFLSHSGVQQGYIDYSTAMKFPAFLSLAHLLYANVTVPKSFNQTPNGEKYQSVVDIEPVTGVIARAFMKIQLNVPIRKNIIRVERIKRKLNISYVANPNEKLYLKSIPVLWGEYGGQASKNDIDTIKKKVIGMLGLSCGILIALPVLGGIFIIVAIVLFVIGAKANQISQLANK